MPVVRISLLLLVLVPGLFAAEFPVGSLSTENLHLISRELYGRGLLDRFEYSGIGEINSDSLTGFAAVLAGRYQLLKDDYSAATNIPGISAGLTIIERNTQVDANTNYLKLFPRLRIDFNRRLSANIQYIIDRELADDSRYEGKLWDGFAGLAENATLDYAGDDFAFRFGVERLSWGFGRSGNLLFDSHAMPIPVLAANYHRSIFEFETVTGFLDPINMSPAMPGDSAAMSINSRYISAHSLTLRPWRNLSFSLREAVLYGGPGRRLEPAYLFPLSWYHGHQLNSGFDDNIFSSIAADYRLPLRLWLYGEFLIDDFQIEKKSRGDYEPDQLAFLVGGEAYDLIVPATTVAIEYARVNNWTYNQSVPHNRYINSGFPIGFPDGPDIESLDWGLSWWRKADFRLAYFGSYKRRGEGRIDSPWTRPWLDIDNYNEPFPTGIIEKTAVNGIRFMALYKNRLWGNIALKLTDIINVENIPGNNQNCWEMKFDLGINLPPISWEH